jgi:hypothetical protein
LEALLEAGNTRALDCLPWLEYGFGAEASGRGPVLSRQIEALELKNRADIPLLTRRRSELEPVTTQDLFAQATWRIAAPVRLIGGVRLSLLPGEYSSIRRIAPSRRPQRESVSVEDTQPLNGQLALGGT